MITPTGTTPAPSVNARDEDAKLRKVATQLEGLFVQQMFKAMRETVPQQEGFVSGGTGEELFTSLMDQHLAAETPKHWEGGLADAVYRQLRGQTNSAPDISVSPNPAQSSTMIVR